MICSTCGNEVDEYARSKQCRACYNKYMSEYMLRRYYKRRDAFVKSRGGICQQCGSTDRLEVDHADPDDKSFNLGKAFSGWSQKRLDKELEKCQVLCNECHSKKTRKDLARRFNQREHWEHGTLAGRRYCDCKDCRLAHSEYMVEYRKKMKQPAVP